jgi:hypothetical protein
MTHWKVGPRVHVGRLLIGAVLSVVALGGCGSLPSAQASPIVEVPAGIPHQRTAQDVEAQIRTWITRDEVSLGRALVPVRIQSVKLVSPGSYLTVRGSNVVVQEVSWLVEFEGTAIHCRLGNMCDLFAAGTHVIPDDPNNSASSLIYEGNQLGSVSSDTLTHPAPGTTGSP